MKFKKILLTSLSLSMAAIPVAGLVACGDDKVSVSDKEAYSQQTLGEDFKIPKGTKVIGEEAFSWAKLPSNFSIPEGVTTIKRKAFWGVVFPKNFKLPKSITKIEYGAFVEATFQSTIVWPKNIKKLPDAVFHRAKFLHAENPTAFPDAEGVFIPEGITHFGDSAFYGVKFPAGFSVPNTLKFVGTTAFHRADFRNLSADFAFPHNMHYGKIIDDNTPQSGPIFGYTKYGDQHKRNGSWEEYVLDAFLRGTPTFDGPGPDYERFNSSSKTDEENRRDALLGWLFDGDYEGKEYDD